MMNFNQYKENKILQLASKYNSLLANLNASPFLEKLSKLDLSKVNTNKRLDFLINENLHLQDNIEFLQKKINDKLIGLDMSPLDKNNSDILSNDSAKTFKNNFDDAQAPQSNSLYKEDVDFLKGEIISLNNILLQINSNINDKLDVSIKELTSLYENVKSEVAILLNKEFKVDLPSVSPEYVSDKILQSLNYEIKNELILMKDSFDIKLEELKNELYKTNKNNFNIEDNSPVYLNDSNENYDSEDLINNGSDSKPNTLHSYYNEDINLKKKDLDQIFGENEIKNIKQSNSLSTINPASINSLEKNISDVNLKLNKMLVENDKQKSDALIEKKYIDATIDIETKWNNIAANMEDNIKIITEENKFLKLKFNELQKKYDALKMDYIDKNNDTNNIEKILSLTNHKFNELSKILDQQDIMMKTLQAENKLFFEKINSQKINKEHTNLSSHVVDNDNKYINSISSNLKSLENKLMNIQYELDEIENDDFDHLIKEYKDKVI